jgi:F0F1-type ATP synthase assembly protein I
VIVTSDQDSRSAVAIGMDWGARATSIGLEFCVPAVLGHFADGWLKTTPWLTVIGAMLGMAIGMLHVLRLPGEIARSEERRKAAAPPRPGASPPRIDPDRTDSTRQETG